jgi:hypothetical protein
VPEPNVPPERSYLFPAEEAKVLAHINIPLVKRVFLGFCAREGVRRSNVVTLE